MSPPSCTHECASPFAFMRVLARCRPSSARTTRASPSSPIRALPRCTTRDQRRATHNAPPLRAHSTMLLPRAGTTRDTLCVHTPPPSFLMRARCATLFARALRRPPSSCARDAQCATYDARPATRDAPPQHTHSAAPFPRAHMTQDSRRRTHA